MIFLEEEAIKGDKEDAILCLYLCCCIGVWICSGVILMTQNSIFHSALSNGAFLGYKTL